MKRLGAGVGFLLKLSPLALLPPAFALWLYLREIQASFFFLPSLASSTGLMVLFWIGVVIFGGLLYLFVVPSLLLMTAEGVCRDGAMLPKKIKGLVLSEAAVCFFFIASSFWFPKTELGAVIFSVPSASALLYSWLSGVALPRGACRRGGAGGCSWPFLPGWLAC